MNPLLLLVMIAAQSGITTPTVGFVRDRAGAVRPIYGLAGNFVPGPPAGFHATAAAFSETLRWIQTEESLFLLDEPGNLLHKHDAPGSPAVFAFSADGTSALALVPETHDLIVWAPAATQPETDESDERRRPPPRGIPRRLRVLALDPLELAGDVVAAGVVGEDRIRLVTRRDQGVWSLDVSASTGAVEHEAVLDGVSTPLLILPDGRLVFAVGAEITIREPTGEEIRLATSAPVEALELMGGQWIHVVVEGTEPASYALDVRTIRPALYRLPEARP
jgi:hypothetical protein